MRSICCGSIALLLAALPVTAQSDPTVRVRLLGSESYQEIEVEAVSDIVRIEVDEREAGALRSGERVTIARSSSRVTASFGNQSMSGQTVRVLGQRLRLRVGRIDREYAGELAVRSVGSKLDIVNASPLRPYVASVVAAELGFDVPEAAKAQAVLARTYALRRLGSNPTYDLDDHQGSQVFRGVGTITATSHLAAESTEGVVMTYSGRLADGTYFSSSGGHTADNESTWSSTPVPYLRGVPDPYDEGSPHHSWETSIPRPQALSALSSVVGTGATGIVIEERSRSGRVTRMHALGASRPAITGAQFRRRINAAKGWRTVKSTKFDLSLEGDQYVLRGGGFGHGVGMSQYGAMGQARLGRDYRHILAHYFTGVVLEGDHALPSPPVAVSEPIRTPSEDRQESLGLHGQYLLLDPRGRVTQDRPGSGSGGSPPGDARRETAPSSKDDRTGERRSGRDRREASGRAGPGRRQSTDRRQTVQETPPAPETTQRRAAW